MSLILDKDNPLATKVQTRDGRKARLLCVDLQGRVPIAAAILTRDTEAVMYFSANGFAETQNYRDCDLINVPVEREYVKVAEFTEDGLWTPQQMPLIDAATKEFLRYIETATKDGFNAGIDAALSWLKAQPGDDFLYAAKRIEGMKR